jgi:hypothetical protein
MEASKCCFCTAPLGVVKDWTNLPCGCTYHKSCFRSGHVCQTTKSWSDLVREKKITLEKLSPSLLGLFGVSLETALSQLHPRPSDVVRLGARRLKELGFTGSLLVELGLKKQHFVRLGKPLELRMAFGLEQNQYNLV